MKVGGFRCDSIEDLMCLGFGIADWDGNLAQRWASLSLPVHGCHVI